MTARDELADEIAGHPIGSGYYSTTVGFDEAREIADAILAAGYRKPRTISTVEELDTLLPGTIVYDRSASIKWGDGQWGTFSGDSVGSYRIQLPATVLYEPQPTEPAPTEEREQA